MLTELWTIITGIYEYVIYGVEGYGVDPCSLAGWCG